MREWMIDSPEMQQHRLLNLNHILMEKPIEIRRVKWMKNRRENENPLVRNTAELTRAD